MGMIHSDDEKKRRDDRKSEKVILISEKMRIFASSFIADELLYRNQERPG